MNEWLSISPADEASKASVLRALTAQRDADEFSARFPKLARRDEVAVSFTWTQLERQLVDLAVRPELKELVPHLVSGTRKQALFKPQELVLREILAIAATVMDETCVVDTDGGQKAP